MSYGSEFVFTLFTDDANLARAADHAGIDRIGLDLETLGKSIRQDSRRHWVSNHNETRMGEVRRSLAKSAFFVRVNPINEYSGSQIEFVLSQGVQVIMLPMFRTVAEARDFAAMVDGRAKTVLLAENRDALAIVDTLLTLPGIDEIHIGLNDLHIDLALHNQFEVLLLPDIEKCSNSAARATMPLAVGGLGRVGDELLTVPSRLIYPFYPVLKLSGSLVSRTFFSPASAKVKLVSEIERARDELDRLCEDKSLSIEFVRDTLRRHLAAL
jgi:hypothetical protein